MGFAVGTTVGVAVGVAVGFVVGVAVGFMVGVAVGVAVGFMVGVAVGVVVGFVVGVAVGFGGGVAVGVAVGFMVVFVVGVAVGFMVGFVVGVVVGIVVGVAVGFVVAVAVGFLVDVEAAVAVGFTVDVIVAVEVTVAVEIGPSVAIAAGLWGVAKELSLSSSSGAFSPKAMDKMIIIITKESPRSASKIHGNGFFFTVAADNTVFSSKDFIQYRQNCALSVNSDLQYGHFFMVPIPQESVFSPYSNRSSLTSITDNPLHRPYTMMLSKGSFT